MSAVALGRPKSAAARAAMSKAKAGKPTHPQSVEARAKVSAARKGKPLSPEHRAKLSAAKIGKPGPWLGVKRGPQSETWRKNIALGNKGKPASYPMRRFHYRGAALRSRWELVVATAFDRLGIEWEFESIRFDLGGTETYMPDFYLPQLGCYWEVKGWFGPKSKRTVDLFRQCYPEIPLIVATADVIAAIDPAFDPRARLQAS